MRGPQLLPAGAPGPEAEADPEEGRVMPNRFCPLYGEAHGPHEFDYSEDGAHYAGHCDGDTSPYAGGRTISPELDAAMDAYAEEAARTAPPLSDDQIRDLRNALRKGGK